MANLTPGNESIRTDQGGHSGDSGDDEEFHSPPLANIAPEDQPRGRAGSRRGLRSNTVIQGRPQDVGRIIERSRSRQRQAHNNNNPPSSSDDDDDAQSDSPNPNEEVKVDQPSSSSSSSSVHPQRQAQVNVANQNAVRSIAISAAPNDNNSNDVRNHPQMNANDDNANRLNSNANRPPAPNARPAARVPSIPVRIGPHPNSMVAQPPQGTSRYPRVSPSGSMGAHSHRSYVAMPQPFQPISNNQQAQPSPIPSISIQQLQQQLQQLTTQVSRLSGTPPAPIADRPLPGLDAEETRKVMKQDDTSDFYAVRARPSNIQFIDDKAATKRLTKDFKEGKSKLKSIKHAIEWFDKFDYKCDKWGIPYHIRYMQCITTLFPDELIDQFRSAAQTQTIDNYADLKRWIFKQRNSRKKIAKADKDINTWTGDIKHTTFQQFTEFAAICNRYAREIRFALDWGMKAHEINRIPESILVDIFMDNASASKKLWEIFQEKIGGNRTMLKAKLLAKHMTFLEQGRATKDQSHQKYSRKKRSKRKKESVHAMQRTGYNPNYGKGRGRGRGNKYHTTGWRKSRYDNRGPHKPPHNCHRYGHTPQTCWVLHPELKPKGGAKRKQIFALQRTVNKAKEDLEAAIRHYESSTESEHNTENETESKHDPESSASTSKEEEDSESSSPIQFKYRPRQ